MNILVLSWRDPKHPLAGGAEQVMHEHMKVWVKEGHSVTFFSSAFKGCKSQENLEGVKILRQGSQYLTVHFLACWWYLFGKHPKFDIVVDQFHGWPFFTPFYVRVPKLAVIQELTRQVWFHYPLPLGLRYVLGPIGYLMEPLFFIPYRKIVFMTGSESAKSELSTVGIRQENIVVVPHGVIINVHNKSFLKDKTPTIIFLGALASDKGIEDAIKAFGLINKSIRTNFWVVGKGDETYLRKLKGLANNVGLEERITFFGFVSQEKKFELLARAHIMINPSIREGWGLVNIEANAMGTPVVAYPSQGLVDSVKNGKSGIICKSSSPEALAYEVTKIIEDSSKYAQLCKESLQWSHNFSWDSSKKASLKLINEVFKRS